MKKDFGPMPAVFPMPVLMIATYDEDGTVDVMNAAWGQICDSDMITLALTETHKTVKNLKKAGAFTVSLADAGHIEAADFFGIASGNKMADKFERSGLTAVRSTRVNAPVIEEFPVTLECELVECGKYGVIGKIVNVMADEAVLDEKGKIDVTKAGIIMFDQFRNGYYTVGEKVGTAWNTGKGLLK
ncbi:MAG: flavin reductase family protein [Oscillospiraceae bacterium]|nr:flavin reductase family protein [Oscillospiraceae bacterium]